jgi:hypothetical protein
MRFCAVLLAAALPMPAADASLDILQAARRGTTRELGTLLLKGADLEAKDKDGRTPLMLAARYGRTDTVRLLLAKGARPDARDAHGWNAYMLALLAPSGGVVHTTHEAVLKLLPQPKHFRLAITASWAAPGKALFSSCFMHNDELTQHMGEIHPDGMVVEALRHYAATSGRDMVAVVSADARGRSEISERPTPQDVDAVLTLLVEPRAICVQQADQPVDQLSLRIQATLNRTQDEKPVLEKSFTGTAIKTGVHGEAAINAIQHGPIYQSWAKSEVGSLYWAVLTALLQD